MSADHNADAVLALYREAKFWRELATQAIHRLADLHREAAQKDDYIAALREEIRERMNR
jgi:hypothetical protein